MNTDSLVRALASDLQVKPAARRIWLNVAAMTSLASLVTLAAILWLLAPSPHLAHGPTQTIIFTVLAGTSLAAGAYWAALRSSYPEGRSGLIWLLLPVGLLFAGVGLEMAGTPRVLWSDHLWGSNPLACFVCVVGLSLPILAAVLFALHYGAPTQRRRTGAMAGLLAGGITAALYTLHCPENSLFFVAAWHVPAVLAVALLGSLAAERFLRW
jgi:hypothetical protein